MEAFAKETDGFMARHFDRKISGAVSRMLVRTPVTPNQITVGVTLLGVAAGAMLAQAGQGWKIGGALVFLLTSILDGCDGEVARAKRMTSRLGGWLDLWGDNVVHIAVFWGLAVGLFRDGGDLLYLTLGKWAVFGTLMSATLASMQMRRTGRSSFSSVMGDAAAVSAASAWTRGLTKASDALARRDFVYAVPVLAVAGKLAWFLWALAVGVNLYLLVLVILFLSTTRSA